MTNGVHICKELELKGTEGNHNKAEIRNGDIAELLEGKGRKHQDPNKKRKKQAGLSITTLKIYPRFLQQNIP